MCVDSSQGQQKVHADFEGFKFTDYADVLKELTPSCNNKNDWISVDLTNRRLIGFKIYESDYIDGRRNVRGIQVITDTPSCDNTKITIQAL